MNKMFSDLKKIDDVTFYLLEHHIHIARMVRNTMDENALTQREMGEIIGIPLKRMREVLTGAYPFDFMLLAKLQKYRQERASAKESFRVEAEGIQFAKYKDSWPIILGRIDDLLKTLEQNKTP